MECKQIVLFFSVQHMCWAIQANDMEHVNNMNTNTLQYSNLLSLFVICLVIYVKGTFEGYFDTFNYPLFLNPFQFVSRKAFFKNSWADIWKRSKL